MTFENFKNEQFKVFLQNQKLTIIAAVLAVVVAIQGFYIIAWANNERTVFLPAYNPTQEFWVAGDRVSASYLEQVGRYIVEVLWNVSPDNAKSVKPAILPLVPSAYWNDVDRSLTQQLSYVTDNAITRVFLISSVKWDEANVIYVKGIIKEVSGDVVSLTKSTTMKIQYKIENGRFWLLGISEVQQR
jgi:conjugal transfer pilus assembly protein TraE